MRKKLFLLDAYALIYRAHFAFINNPRINSKGLGESKPIATNDTDEGRQRNRRTEVVVTN